MKLTHHIEYLLCLVYSYKITSAIQFKEKSIVRLHITPRSCHHIMSFSLKNLL